MEQAVALAGPVADVIAAFEHGEILVGKIQEKRAQKGVPLPPAALGQSFVRGPRAIKEAYETGREAYGDSFRVENDRIALDAFKNILINLQSTFFQHLFTAQEDDTMQDFGVVINAATMARVKGVSILNEMFMRMAETPAPRDSTGQQNIRQQPSFGSHQSQQSQPTSPDQDSSFTSPVPGFTWNGNDYTGNADVNSRPYDSTRGTAIGMLPTNPQPHHHPIGVIKSPTSHSYTSSDATSLTILSEDVDLTKFPAPPTKKPFRQLFSKPKPHVETAREDPQGQNLNLQRPNSISSDGKSVHGSSSGASFLSGASPETGPHPQWASPSDTSAKKITNKIPFHASPPAEYRKRLNNKPKSKTAVALSPDSSHRPGLIQSMSHSRKLSLLAGSKAPKDDFAGFCEGAYLMQTGHDGMKIRNQSVSMTGQNNYWACSNSKCCFEGHAVPKKDGHKKANFGFDEDILESHGVSYRWSFLAKSHTTIGNSKAGFEYQCVFCIGRGVTPFRVKGNRKFIEHVATHQGESPNKYKMPRFNYVVGRLASPWENFDINLPAATAMELETMETPSELEALEPGLPEMEAPFESPLRTARPIRENRGFSESADRSGLGIRMGVDSVYRVPSTSAGDARNDIRPVDSGRHPVASENTTQPLRSVDDHYRSNTTEYYQNSTQLSSTSPTSGGETPVSDEPLEKSWSHVRDSVQGLHPAPLFARKPVAQPLPPTPSHGQTQQNSASNRTHPDAHLPQFDESDGFEINSPDPCFENHGGKFLSTDHIVPHHSSQDVQAVQMMEYKQASLMTPETAHEMSTPEMRHPGTKWMD